MTVLTPRVSVICSWYNRANFIRDTVDSLLGQSLDAYEIILVNDGSPDPTVREILDTYDNPRLRVFHRENVGLVRAFQFAVEQSCAPYIAIQGAGDVSLPDRLKSQHALLESDLGLVATGTWFDNVLLAENMKRSVANSYRPERQRFTQADTIRANPLSHGEVMFRRSSYEKCGGYRTLFAKSQDRDLWLRMTNFGDIGIVPEVLYERRIFSKDGIASSMSARSQQAAFAAFSVQCLSDRAQFGVDLLTEFGDHAALFRQPSTRLAKQLALFGIVLALQGNQSRARIYATLAMREKRQFWPVLSSLFVWFMGISIVPKLLRFAIVERIKKLPKIQQQFLWFN